MAKRASNADRIARAAAEAEATTREKAARKKTTAGRAKTAGSPAKKRATRRKTPKAPPRLKVIWTVGVPGLAPVKTFPYREREAADADAERRGKGCVVRPLKVPME